MDALHKYNVQVSGKDLPQPADFTLDFQELVGDLAIEAKHTKDPDVFQQSALSIVVYRVSLAYTALIDDITITISADDITIRKPSSEEFATIPMRVVK